MGTVVLAGATSGSTTLTPVDAVTATITLPSATCTLAGVGVNIGSQITNSLSGDVVLNNVSNYFVGPSVAQGSTGTWFVIGTVTCRDTSAAGYLVKLWDGTTLIASCRATGGANFDVAISLSGFIVGPVGNLRISVRDESNATGVIAYNSSGNAKDSTITAFRIG